MRWASEQERSSSFVAQHPHPAGDVGGVVLQVVRQPYLRGHHERGGFGPQLLLCVFGRAEGDRAGAREAVEPALVPRPVPELVQRRVVELGGRRELAAKRQHDDVLGGVVAGAVTLFAAKHRAGVAKQLLGPLDRGPARALFLLRAAQLERLGLLGVEDREGAGDQHPHPFRAVGRGRLLVPAAGAEPLPAWDHLLREVKAAHAVLAAAHPAPELVDLPQREPAAVGAALHQELERVDALVARAGLRVVGQAQALPGPALLVGRGAPLKLGDELPRGLARVGELKVARFAVILSFGSSRNSGKNYIKRGIVALISGL